jgi:hypothetical protein
LGKKKTQGLSLLMVSKCDKRQQHRSNEGPRPRP